MVREKSGNLFAVAGEEGNKGEDSVFGIGGRLQARGPERKEEEVVEEGSDRCRGEGEEKVLNDKLLGMAILRQMSRIADFDDKAPYDSVLISFHNRN